MIKMNEDEIRYVCKLINEVHEADKYYIIYQPILNLYKCVFVKNNKEKWVLINPNNSIGFIMSKLDIILFRLMG